jgi:AraC family transcriptional regulator
MKAVMIQRGSLSIRQFLRGNSSLRFSSSQLAWQDAVLEQHETPAGERQEAAIDSFILLLQQGMTSSHCDHVGSSAFGSAPSIPTRSLMFFSPGILPAVRSTETVNLLLCAVDGSFLSEAQKEMSDEGIECVAPDALPVGARSVFFDSPLRQILLLMSSEIRTGGLSGRLYLEHLTHALAARLLTRGRDHSGRKNPNGEGLPSKILGKMLDRIKSEPTADFDLSSLATETGYSRRHFLRTFRASTGLSPYQYILRLRLERARQLMHKRPLTLLDIALESGFTSNAHLSNAFRQHFGISPSNYRRSLI